MKKTSIQVIFDRSNSRHAQAFDLMKRHCGFFRITEKKSADYALRLAEDCTLPPESYRVEKTGDTAFTVYAPDRLGMIHGVGRVLHRGPANLKDETCVPEKEYRCIYFASHFGNFYHVAPMEEITEYLEDLALWGCNYVQMWFDKHHFTGFRDPHAQAFLKKMHAIYAAAKNLGMHTTLGMPINEYYAGGPKEALATNSIEGTEYFREPIGYYHTELCPSTEEGLRLLIESHREVMRYFADVGLDTIGFGVYDQGGCTCKKCRPWGTNGYIRLAKILEKEFRAVYPNCKISLSTWRFDDFVRGEWDGLLKMLPEIAEHFEFLGPDLESPKTPAELFPRAKALGLKIGAFPEISMMEAVPWGGFGAVPAPERIRRVYLPTAEHHCGGGCYSEGLFEDTNKIIMLGLFMGHNTIDEAVDDYFRFYFTEASVPFAKEFAFCLDKTMPRTRFNYKGEEENYPPENADVSVLPTFQIHDTSLVERACELGDAIREAIPPAAAKSWRFRALWLRTRMDRELMKTGGAVSPTTDRIAKQLEKILRAEEGEYCVAPITIASIRGNKGHI